MSVESKSIDSEPKSSRRGFIADALTGVFALASGADLGRRKADASARQEASREEYRRLLKEGSKLYPRSPIGIEQYPSLYSPSDEAIQQFKQSEVITGYDEKGQPIKLGFLEGEELIKALQDRHGGLNFDSEANARIKGEEVLKPDGSRYTHREWLMIRPEVYNYDLRERMNFSRHSKWIDWVNERYNRVEPETWSFRDTIQVALIAPFALRMGGRLTSVLFPPLTMDEVISGTINRIWHTPGADQEKIEKYVGPHLQQITQTFENYFFKGLEIPKDCEEINFLSVGEGFQAGFDALAFSILSRQLGRKANIVNICSQTVGRELATKDWEHLQQMHLVDNSEVKFLDEFARYDPKKYFAKVSPSVPLVVAMRNTDSPFAEGFPKQVKEVVLPAVTNARSQGASIRLIVTSESKEKHPKMSDLNILDDPNQPLKLVLDCELNPAAREEDNWSDKYISVLDFNLSGSS